MFTRPITGNHDLELSFQGSNRYGSIVFKDVTPEQLAEIVAYVLDKPLNVVQTSGNSALLDGIGVGLPTSTDA